MQVKVTNNSPTEVTLDVVVQSDELIAIKEHVLTHFQDKVKLPGFRDGKAPLAMVEKNVDPASLQQSFLEEAINQIYPQAVRSEKLRVVAQPDISVKKFVPFSTLEFGAKVSVVGEVKLADYKKLKKARPTVSVTAKDVDGVIESLRERVSDKKDVDRAAKKGDQVWIDFSGKDKSGKPVKGADGKDYPIILGSNTFIPGFEDNVVGLKAGGSKEFEVTFPKDYSVKSLQNQKVEFSVTVTKVQEVVKPVADDDFAAKAGPFKTLKELKDDIKKQLKLEKGHQAGLDYESELLRELTAKSKVTIPGVLIDNQVERMLAELKQNLVYRGQTYQEFLDSEKLNEEKHRAELKPAAEERVKASLVLAEVSELEGIEVTPEELEIRMQVLKGQYKDAKMQEELDKPEARREIAARMLSEKTVAKLAGYASK